MAEKRLENTRQARDQFSSQSHELFLGKWKVSLKILSLHQKKGKSAESLRFVSFKGTRSVFPEETLEER